MTAAVVVLAVGGSVSPSGDLTAFGLEGAQAHTAIDFTPLGVGLVGRCCWARCSRGRCARRGRTSARANCSYGRARWPRSSSVCWAGSCGRATAG
ncbi:hypothetical protein NKH77_12790 [Streptomyces sp. M19]